MCLCTEGLTFCVFVVKYLLVIFFMSGEDKTKLIVSGNLEDSGDDLHSLGVSSGDTAPVNEDGSHMAQLRAVALSMRASLLEFMDAQSGSVSAVADLVYKPALRCPKKFSSDQFFFDSPVEILPNGTARAVAKMHYNLRWSSSLVHSADMVFSAAGVVEALLEDEEKVVGVQSLRFLNPVQNNVEMFAYAGETSEEVSVRCAERKPDLKATFLTKNAGTGVERKIQLFGFQNKQDASRNEASSDMARLPASLSKFEDIQLLLLKSGLQVFAFNLAKPDFVIAGTLLGSGLNTVMELVMRACIELRGTDVNPFPRGAFNLAYNFDFKKLPEVKKLDEKCQLMLFVNKDGIVEKPNGFRLIPIMFAIRREGVLLCEGIYTSAQPVDGKVAWDYQDRL